MDTIYNMSYWFAKNNYKLINLADLNLLFASLRVGLWFFSICIAGTMSANPFLFNHQLLIYTDNLLEDYKSHLKKMQIENQHSY